MQNTKVKEDAQSTLLNPYQILHLLLYFSKQSTMAFSHITLAFYALAVFHTTLTSAFPVSAPGLVSNHFAHPGRVLPIESQFLPHVSRADCSNKLPPGHHCYPRHELKYRSLGFQVETLKPFYIIVDNGTPYTAAVELSCNSETETIEVPYKCFVTAEKTRNGPCTISNEYGGWIGVFVCVN